MSNQRMRELFLENIERQRMGGDLVAGRRKRKAKYSKATPAQLAALKKARAAKKRRGGDFEDLGDSDYRLFGAAYKNPIEKARKLQAELKQNEDWYEYDAWKAESKLIKQAALDGLLLAASKKGATPKEIDDAYVAYKKKLDDDMPAKYKKYIKERSDLKKSKPYLELYRKYGVKPTLAELKALA